jgi:hypothetical protein
MIASAFQAGTSVKSLEAETHLNGITQLDGSSLIALFHLSDGQPSFSITVF